jgi:uncharacterized protein (DUF302 family)
MPASRISLRRRKAASVAIFMLALCAGARAQSPSQPGMPIMPMPMMLPAPAQSTLPPNTMLAPMPRDMKRQWAQLFMMFNPVGVRDLLNVMAHKVPARPGLSVDEVVGALIARAEKHGFLLVNRYQMWRELQAMTGVADPYKVEVVSICDPQVSRDWMDYAPEMALFVPPRIAVVEDRNRQIWLLMLDWDMHWLDTARNAAFDPKLRAQGLERRERLEDIMRAAANGEK